MYTEFIDECVSIDDIAVMMMINIVILYMTNNMYKLSKGFNCHNDYHYG